jgi:hypothetical protein
MIKYAKSTFDKKIMICLVYRFCSHLAEHSLGNAAVDDASSNPKTSAFYGRYLLVFTISCLRCSL